MPLIDARALEVEKEINQLRDSLRELGFVLPLISNDDEFEMAIEAIRSSYHQLQIAREDMRLMLADVVLVDNRSDDSHPPKSLENLVDAGKR